MLVIFCAILTVMILQPRAWRREPDSADSPTSRTADVWREPRRRAAAETRAAGRASPMCGSQDARPAASPSGARTTRDGAARPDRDADRDRAPTARSSSTACRRARARARPTSCPSATSPSFPDGTQSDRPARPVSFLDDAPGQRRSSLWGSEKIADDDGSETTVYYPKSTHGLATCSSPGAQPDLQRHPQPDGWPTSSTSSR